jgi:hypothetical protein
MAKQVFLIKKITNIVFKFNHKIMKYNSSIGKIRKTIALTLILCISASFAFTASAQGDDNSLKKFRFGLKAAPSFNWYKPSEKKKMESGGLKFNFSYGLVTEFRLSSVASLATGLQVDYDGGKINFIDSAYYFIANDELIANADTGGAKPTQYRLLKREYKNTYLTLPITLKMKTKEIGMLTYFGQFGLNSSFKLKSRVDDDVAFANPPNGNASQTDLDNGKDMNLIKFALNVGAGAEYNLSGSTSFFFGVNYYNGFSSVTKPNSKFLQKGKFDKTPVKQNATSNAVAITVGILF